MFDLNNQHPLIALAKLSTALALPRVLREAARLRLGGFISDGPRSLQEIAAHFALDQNVLNQFMDVLVSQEIFIEKQGLYHATELSAELDALDQSFLGIDSWHAWTRLDDSLRTGIPSFQLEYGTDFYTYLAANPQKNTNWKRWMTVTSTSWLSTVAKQIPIEDGQSVCDVGGGEGEFLAQILKEHPECQGSLLERPEVTSRSETKFEGIPGDMFKAVPRGHDVYLVSRVCCNLNDKELVHVLKNIVEAMEPHSRLIIMDGIMPVKGDINRSKYAGNSLGLFLLFGSRIREESEFDSLLKLAGLRIESIERLDTRADLGWSLMVASPF